MRHILTYLKPFKNRIILGFSIKTFGTLAELLLPYILTHILDKVIRTAEVSSIVFYGVIMVICAFIACISNIIANRIAAGVTTKFSLKMREDLFKKTLYLSSRDTDEFTIPSLESRITTDTYNVHNFIGMMQRMGVRAPILLIGGISITLLMDKMLALVMIATLPFIFVVVYGISKKGVPLYVGVQKSIDEMVRVVREDAQGIRVIKALSKNDYENRRYDMVNSTLSKKERKAGIVTSAAHPFMTFIMNSGIAGVVNVAAICVSKGQSSTATVIAFMQYFTLISMAMMCISRIFVMYTKCAASAKRITEVLMTPDRYFVDEDKTLKNDGYINFKNVSFSYLGKKPNLKNISFSLKKGQSLGIIGATGSGKSTLIKLLLRFYETDSGEITLLGRKITSYTREELTSLFGASLHNGFVYADTIRENICFGRELSQQQIDRAVRIAQAEEFITALPEGYDKMLSSFGTNVSGGQRQRLLIARAVAANPPILILDDSSSALDYKTAANLRKAIKTEMAGTTVINVAQRISTVKDCDLILVLEDGEIIGKGKHEQLLEECKEYREISESQMGGAFVE